MEKQQDSRWQQRFDNYLHALGRLQEEVSLADSRELSEIEKQGQKETIALVLILI